MWPHSHFRYKPKDAPFTVFSYDSTSKISGKLGTINWMTRINIYQIFYLIRLKFWLLENVTRNIYHLKKKRLNFTLSIISGIMPLIFLHLTYSILIPNELWKNWRQNRFEIEGDGTPILTFSFTSHLNHSVCHFRRLDLIGSF